MSNDAAIKRALDRFKINVEEVDVIDYENNYAVAERHRLEPVDPGLVEALTRIGHLHELSQARLRASDVLVIAAAVAEAVVELRRDPAYAAQALIEMPPDERDRVLELFDAIKQGGG